MKHKYHASGDIGPYVKGQELSTVPDLAAYLKRVDEEGDPSAISKMSDDDLVKLAEEVKDQNPGIDDDDFEVALTEAADEKADA